MPITAWFRRKFRNWWKYSRELGFRPRDILSYDKTDISVFIFKYFRLKWKSLSVEQHRHVAWKQSRKWRCCPSQFAFRFRNSSCVCYCHCSNLTGFSQTYVIFRSLKEKILLSRGWIFLSTFGGPLDCLALSSRDFRLHVNTALQATFIDDACLLKHELRLNGS
jgi:hypothetical protein